ncbi:arrestin domain-containing protein 3-like isoform X1 [Cheilinus undulatus]|uniref:arrestin domain-containing protein 3-like isoform X1 n=1 Tax=Cheilinus undulatus TaxID=241271 RepID=UPI001BD37E4A|nr:arrestin domain-containing protein 3-like isoform X1 [Cheilinus undulatus]
MFQTIKNFNIHFNSLNERNTIGSGDLVTGHVSFELTKETKITSITMAIRGKASVSWLSDRTRKRSERHRYSAKLEYFDVKSFIIQDKSASGKSTKLQPGTHMFPFTCQLPLGDFPPSFHGMKGQIVYTMTVGINRPWNMCKEFEAKLNFINRIDINRPILGAPVSGSNSKKMCVLCCFSGDVTMKVSTEKKAFSPGETVKLICEFSNGSSQIVTPKVRLNQREVYHTVDKNNSEVRFKQLVLVTGRPINPHTSGVHNEIMLSIPSEAAFSFSNGIILEVEHLIEVRLRARFSSDLIVLIPIIICDAFLSSQPPPYSAVNV